jgi:hypothetical protein
MIVLKNTNTGKKKMSQHSKVHINLRTDDYIFFIDNKNIQILKLLTSKVNISKDISVKSCKDLYCTLQ